MYGLRLRPDVVVGPTISRWDHFWAVFGWCIEMEIRPWTAAWVAWGCMKTKRDQ